MIKVEIKGAGQTLQADSLEIEDAIDERSTCSFIVVDKDYSQIFKKGEPVEVYIVGAPDELIFGGVIEKATGIEFTPEGILKYQIECIDYHYAADKRTAVKVYQSKTTKEIVQDLFDSYLDDEDITVGDIDTGPDIEEAVFNYVPVSRCLDVISERANMWWRIDKEKKLYFQERTADPAPWTVTEADVLAGSLSIEHSAPKYRNKQIIRGPIDETSEQIEYSVGDGEKQAFPLGYPLARVPTIEILYDGSTGYVEETRGIKGLEEGKDWYWSKADPIILQTSTGDPLTVNDKMKVTYTGQYPVVVISSNYSGITDRQTVEGFGTGKVEDVRQEPQQNTRAAVFQLAGQLLNKYSVIGKTVKFLTYKSGLEPGQLVTINTPDYGVTNVDMLIESVKIRDVGIDYLLYDVQCVQGPEMGSWTKIFGEIIARGQMVIRENIDEDEVLLKGIPFTKDWDSTEAVNIFNEIYPSTSPLYHAHQGLSFEPENRIKYVAWYGSSATSDELGRKEFTVQNTASEGSTQIYTGTYMNPFDGVGQEIEYFGWVGGMKASTAAADGIIVDFQIHPDGKSTKSDIEAWDIQKTDSRWV